MTIWLDLRDPDRNDLAVLSEEFGLHPLAIEDAVHEHQRPKLDRYRSHLFLTVYGARLDVDSGKLATSELTAFVTPQALITVRKDDGLDIGAVVERWDASPDLAGFSVGFLLYGLLDYVVDGHFETVQSMHEAVESLEDQLFADDPQDLARPATQLRTAQEPGTPPPDRDPHARDREHPDAARPAGRRGRFHALLPGHLRSCAPRHRMDGQLAGPSEEHPGDEPDHPGQPAEHHHQEGHELGGDHRGADALLHRAESAVRAPYRGGPGAALGARRPGRRPRRQPARPAARGRVAVGPRPRRDQDRTVPPHPRPPQVAVQALRAWAASQADERLAAGQGWQDTGLVFTTHRGAALDAGNVRKMFKRVCAAAGAGDGWTPRELRTTFVSLLSHRGVSIEEIARLAGHASTRTTEIVYRRELRPVITTGAEIMDELFGAS